MKDQQKNKIQNIDEIPIQDSKRQVNDKICIIIAIILALIPFITSLAVINLKNLTLTNYPTDNNGKLCGYDYPYQEYLYFADTQNLTRRVCVQQCPNANTKVLLCQPTSDIGCKASTTPGFVVTIYDSVPQLHTSGKFCIPVNQKLKQQVYKSQLNQKKVFAENYHTIFFCVLISLGLGIIYSILVQFFPTIMLYISVLVGSSLSILLVVLFITYNFDSGFGYLLVLCIIFILIGCLILVQSIKKFVKLRLILIFLQQSTTLIKQIWSITIYILLYLIFTLILGLLCLFEFLAVWSAQIPKFELNQIFLQSNSSIGYGFSVLIIIQFLWGLSYLKQSFNFNISGVACQYYFSNYKFSSSKKNKKIKFSDIFIPLKRQLRFHFGSIIGGSFLILILTIFDFIFDILKPPINSNQSYHYIYYHCICGWLDRLLSFCRTDSMGYINITALDYCTSASRCQQITENSYFFQDGQQLARYYVYGAHLLLSSIVGLVGLYNKGNIILEVEILIIILSLFVTTYFITLHSDGMEGLIICFMFDEYYSEKRGKQMLNNQNILLNKLSIYIQNLPNEQFEGIREEYDKIFKQLNDFYQHNKEIQIQVKESKNKQKKIEQFKKKFDDWKVKVDQKNEQLNKFKEELKKWKQNGHRNEEDIKSRNDSLNKLEEKVAKMNKQYEQLSQILKRLKSRKL